MAGTILLDSVVKRAPRIVLNEAANRTGHSVVEHVTVKNLLAYLPGHGPRADEFVVGGVRNGIIIVDHGSRLSESNRMLEEVAAALAARFRERYEIVEPAHMELAEPSIGTAYARCVDRGATRIVVCPYFLGPGKHWTHDIPRLTAEAHQRFPQTQYHVTQTLGLDDLILDLLNKRIRQCIDADYLCPRCEGTLRSGTTPEPGCT